MKTRIKKFDEASPVELLLLRNKLGIGRYIKTGKRDDEKRKLLLDIALKKIEEKEKDDFIPVGFRKRRMKVL
jgi:hypothetical protein